MIQLCPRKEKEAALTYLENRFSLSPPLFSSFQFYLSSKGRILLGPPSLPSLPFLSAGLTIARISPAGAVKPTSALLQLFGQEAKKNTIELTRVQAVSFLSGESFSIETPEAEDGYVLLTYNSAPLGCALLKSSAASGRQDGTSIEPHPKEFSLKNMLPKAKRRDVQFL